MNELKCPRCGRDGHLPAECDVPVLPDDRVLREKPDALRLADELLEPVEGFPSPTTLEKQAAALLRTQHADLERKDALLRQALDTIHEAQTYTNSEAWSPSMTRDLQMLRLAITKELQ